MKYAKLPFKTLIQPAIELAEKGFKLTDAQVEDFNEGAKDFLRLNTAPVAFVKKGGWKKGGPWTFVLAGSGHIAGVVNPPDAGKYQYWTNPAKVATLDAFVEGATETKGSWWPHWRAWLETQDGAMVAAKGKRVPGGKGDAVIEDAPGRYVMTR